MLKERIIGSALFLPYIINARNTLQNSNLTAFSTNVKI